MLQQFKHSFKVSAPAQLPLVVYNVGFQKCSPGYGWGPGVRDHYLIHYVVSGKGVLTVNDQEIPLEAGAAFLIRPDVPVQYQADTQTPWEYYWVGFSGASAPLFLAQTDFAHSDHLALPYGDSFRQSLLDIYKVRGNDYPSAVAMAGYLQVSLSLLMTATPAQDGLQYYATTAAAFIQQNYSHPITVESIAEHIGVSRSYLCRGFQAEFHQSPQAYLIGYRLQRACQLLLHSTLSVKAIATSVGFEDQLYFSRAFHRVHGVPPTAYRKAQQ